MSEEDQVAAIDRTLRDAYPEFEIVLTKVAEKHHIEGDIDPRAWYEAHIWERDRDYHVGTTRPYRLDQIVEQIERVIDSQ